MSPPLAFLHFFLARLYHINQFSIENLPRLDVVQF